MRIPYKQVYMIRPYNINIWDFPIKFTGPEVCLVIGGRILPLLTHLTSQRRRDCVNTAAMDAKKSMKENKEKKEEMDSEPTLSKEVPCGYCEGGIITDQDDLPSCGHEVCKDCIEQYEERRDEGDPCFLCSILCFDCQMEDESLTKKGCGHWMCSDCDLRPANASEPCSECIDKEIHGEPGKNNHKRKRETSPEGEPETKQPRLEGEESDEDEENEPTLGSPSSPSFAPESPCYSPTCTCRKCYPNAPPSPTFAPKSPVRSLDALDTNALPRDTGYFPALQVYNNQVRNLLSNIEDVIVPECLLKRSGRGVCCSCNTFMKVLVFIPCGHGLCSNCARGYWLEHMHRCNRRHCAVNAVMFLRYN